MMPGHRLHNGMRQSPNTQQVTAYLGMAAPEHFTFRRPNAYLPFGGNTQNRLVLGAKGGRQYKFSDVVQQTSRKRVIYDLLPGTFHGCDRLRETADRDAVVPQVMAINFVEQIIFDLGKDVGGEDQSPDRIEA